MKYDHSSVPEEPWLCLEIYKAINHNFQDGFPFLMRNENLKGEG